MDLSKNKYDKTPNCSADTKVAPTQSWCTCTQKLKDETKLILKNKLLNATMMKKSSDVSTSSTPPVSAPSSVRPSLAKGISARLRGTGGSSRRSLLGELLRGSVPPWIERLEDSGMSLDEEKKRKAECSECALCNVSLKGAKDLEPANKKVCRCCKAVVCRQCAVHVHVLGHIRRRYVCFKCVGEAATASKLVPPVIVVEKVEVKTIEQVPSPRLVPQDSSSMEHDAREESILSTFVSRLWDTWSGWNGQSEEAISEAEEELSAGEEETTTTVVVKKAIEASGQEKMDKMNELLEGAEGKFDGDSLKSLLELSHGFKGDSTLILSVPFTKACLEVIKLMAGLGKAFEFAGSDMNDKLQTMTKRTNETAAEAKVPISEVTLQMMVEREIKAKTTHAGKKAAGATRTIVRLLWFLDFIGVLLSKLANEQKAPLANILSATYEETLGPRHIWVLRRIVRAGMGMVPDKKHFIPKLGLEGLKETEQAAKLKDWAATVDVVRADMWKYMESKGLTEIP